jgi:hypothetical protein
MRSWRRGPCVSRWPTTSTGSTRISSIATATRSFTWSIARVRSTHRRSPRAAWLLGPQPCLQQAGACDGSLSTRPRIERARPRGEVGTAPPDRRRGRLRPVVLRVPRDRRPRDRGSAHPPELEGPVLGPREIFRRAADRVDRFFYPEATSAGEQWQLVVMNDSIAAHIASLDPTARSAVESTLRDRKPPALVGLPSLARAS